MRTAGTVRFGFFLSHLWNALVVLLCTGTLAFAAADNSTDSSAFPSRPMRIIVPSTPGGPIDIIARLLGQQMGKDWGQSVIVEGRPGADGIIGTQAAATSASDGYTTLIVANGFALNPFLHAHLPYDTVNDFRCVSMLASSPMVLVAHPSLPARSLQELMTLAKSKPGSLSNASSGIGSSGWLATELLRSMTGVDLLLVPYKGAGAAKQSVLTGETNVEFINPVAVQSFIASGQLRALAVTSARRSATMKDVPAISEMVPGFQVLTFFAMMVAAKTPEPVISKLGLEVDQAMTSPGVKARLTDLGLNVEGLGPEKCTDFLKSEMDKWSRVLVQRGIKPQ